MKSIIVDDNKLSILLLKTLCEKNNDIEIIGVFYSAVEALKFLNSNNVDLIFLDIQMPIYSGFDFIKTLKNPPNIIITTSNKEYAYDAFEYEFIVSFLVKPIKQILFDKAIEKVVIQKKIDQKDQNLNNDFLYVNIDRRLTKMRVSDIYIIEAKGDYIHIKTEEENYLVHSTLKKIQDKLPEHLFLKIHRSFIINLKKIVDIENNSILIKKQVIPISRVKRPLLMKRLNLL